jgi:hypothetical protein
VFGKIRYMNYAGEAWGGQACNGECIAQPKHRVSGAAKYRFEGTRRAQGLCGGLLLGPILYVMVRMLRLEVLALSTLDCTANCLEFIVAQLPALLAAAAAAAAAGCKRKFDIAKYVSWVNKEVRAAKLAAA